ncbi:MAG: helix-turn-helix transcriptional regulator [Steroidobacteraceae bacterium]|jgi:DNA-binding XRE family transcriptional regulator
MSNRRRTFEQFREKALKKHGVKAAYEALAPAFEMKRRMIAMRKAAGLTQEQMAERLGTKKSNISRLESVTSGVSPRFSTVEDYARVLGYRIKVDFEPRVR